MPQSAASFRLRAFVLVALIGFGVAVEAPAQPQGQFQGQPQGQAGSSGPPAQPLPPPGRMIDLSVATCAQFAALPRADKEQIVLWLAGFYAGAAQRPRIDIALLSGAARALDELCARAPAAPLIGQETRPLLLR